jgi:Uma2 family endonuclease
VLNPCLIVEVLSPSTAKYDRTEKLAHYQQLAALETILLVNHSEPLLEVWQRDESGRWLDDAASHRNEAAELPSLGPALPLDVVYRDPLAS